MKNILFATLAAVTLLPACNKLGSYTGKEPGKGIDSVSYAVGLQIAQQLQMGGLDSTVNVDMIARGIYDVMNNKKPLFGGDTVMLVLMKHFNPEAYSQMQINEQKEKDFLAQNAKNPGVKSTPSGLQYEVITEGAGAKPTAESTVKVHYTGTHLDGKIFDSSVSRGEPVSFPLNGVIKGWTEGLQLMTVGSKYKFYIPGKLAYGVQGSPQGNIGPNETLVFEVELLAIEEAKPQISQEALQKAFEEAMKSEGK